MTWRDYLRPASFRGVPFHREDVGRGLGRRVITHEYPGRDDPYHEDLGEAPTEIDVVAYVLEPDHVGKAERLAAARLGPGSSSPPEPPRLP